MNNFIEPDAAERSVVNRCITEIGGRHGSVTG